MHRHKCLVDGDQQAILVKNLQPLGRKIFYWRYSEGYVAGERDGHAACRKWNRPRCGRYGVVGCELQHWYGCDVPLMQLGCSDPPGSLAVRPLRVGWLVCVLGFLVVGVGGHVLWHRGVANPFFRRYRTAKLSSGRLNPVS